MTEPTDEEKRAFWRAVATDPTAANVLREITAAPKIDIHTIAWPVWRALLEPNKCSMEDFGAGHQAGLVRMCGLDEACRTPAGEAELARLREIAEGPLGKLLVRDGTKCANPLIAAGLVYWSNEGQQWEHASLGRAAIAYLEGRSDGE